MKPLEDSWEKQLSGEKINKLIKRRKLETL